MTGASARQQQRQQQPKTMVGSERETRTKDVRQLGKLRTHATQLNEVRADEVEPFRPHTIAIHCINDGGKWHGNSLQ